MCVKAGTVPSLRFRGSRDHTLPGKQMMSYNNNQQQQGRRNRNSSTTRGSTSTRTNLISSVEDPPGILPYGTFPNNHEETPFLLSRSVDQEETMQENRHDNNNDDDDDDNNDDDNNNEEEENEEEEEEEDPERHITRLTRRLRLFFRIITFPILPTGALVILALNMFMIGFIMDSDKTCSRSMGAYFITSCCLFFYAPMHPFARRLFPGDLARRYDQIAQSLVILYVYAGISLVQTCREDEQHAWKLLPETTTEAKGDVNPNTTNNTNNNNNNNQTSSADEDNAETCSATCPNLYAALVMYVTTLEIFMLSLLIPLLCLPCVYVWFLRQATSNQETMALLRERLREEEESFLSGTGTRLSSVTTDEILQQLESVLLVRKGEEEEEDADADQVVVVPSDATSTRNGKVTNGALDCCICMNEFDIILEEDLGQRDVESGDHDEQQDSLNIENSIVRTRACGHLFHKHCIASWIGGRWQPRSSSSTRGRQEDEEQRLSAWRQRRAKRSSCPLCRRDLRSSDE